MSDDEVPEGLGDVKLIRPRLQSKADAKRVLRLCAEGTKAWKGCATAEGFILEMDCRRARAIFEGILDPDPGRPPLHDHAELDRLIDEAAAELPDRVNRAEVCRRVSARYSGTCESRRQNGQRKRSDVLSVAE